MDRDKKFIGAVYAKINAFKVCNLSSWLAKGYLQNKVLKYSVIKVFDMYNSCNS